MTNQDSNRAGDRSVDVDNYDRGITPAETAARKEREGAGYKQPTRDPEAVEKGDIDTTGGYTVDKEGLANNYAIEPEMYINEPGDLRQEEEANAAERTDEMQEVNETDETGRLTMEKDTRGKGPGVV
ncbi:MAG: hypothetical protein HC840_23095 [Leptolyngbyaceae cyanobacterium RM2_2_4]|nr:hypothetical protein [Leptolyngbyaceae cyanobacterium SM1_4_3]NJN59210.1 hypothetical protein [Leptolyngbyaceae cyanobacterium SL_5_9]NJO51819.1 hypothetical protein [Leptolyngbyaceae cyanobacterium RM2_2_4]NJO66451.1 hypothetical protein [Leptolyngbyaceae cyanobacterium RM1_405_57]